MRGRFAGLPRGGGPAGGHGSAGRGWSAAFPGGRARAVAVRGCRAISAGGSSAQRCALHLRGEIHHYVYGILCNPSFLLKL